MLIVQERKTLFPANDKGRELAKHFECETKINDTFKDRRVDTAGITITEIIRFQYLLPEETN